MVSNSLVTTYVTAAISLVIIVLRLTYRLSRQVGSLSKRLQADDYWVLVSIPQLLARSGMIHAVLVLGTNNTAEDDKELLGISEKDLKNRVLGSKLVIMTRLLFPGFIWSLKSSLLVFFGRMAAGRRGHQRLLKGLWAILVLTFIAIIISLLAPCRPFKKKWQVIPDPGRLCTEYTPYLFVTACCNIVTDFLIMVFPIRIIWTSLLPLRRKIQVGLLFSLGIFCIVMSSIRAPINFENHSLQSSRTFWSSLEMMTATIVANAPSMRGILRDWTRKRRERSNSGPRSSRSLTDPERSGARRVRHHGPLSLPTMTDAPATGIWTTGTTVVGGADNSSGEIKQAVTADEIATGITPSIEEVGGQAK